MKKRQKNRRGDSLIKIGLLLFTIVLFVAALTCFAACAKEDDPEKVQNNIGILFNDSPVENNVVEMDYSNALSGIYFYDKTTSDYSPISLEALSVQVGDTALSEDYSFSNGMLFFDAEFMKTLPLDSATDVSVDFGSVHVAFSIYMRDAEEPAYRFESESLKSVYLLGEDITLPTAVRSTVSIQDLTFTYTLEDEDEQAISAISEEGNYSYTFQVIRNGQTVVAQELNFSVFTPSSIDFADKRVVSVLGGSYDETEQAAKFSGTATLQSLSMPEEYGLVRYEYKGTGTIAFDGIEHELDASEYTVGYVHASDFNTLRITAEEIYFKSITASDSTFVHYNDYATQNFASSDVMPIWAFNSDYGTPVFDNQEEAIRFPQNENSWTYRLSYNVLFGAQEAGYNAVTVTAKGGSGYVNVFVSGEWNSDESMTLNDGANYVTRTLYFGDLAITEDSGITVLATSRDVFLKEIRFETIDLLQEDLIQKKYIALWGYNADYGTPAWDSEQNAIKLPANGNTWCYTLESSILQDASNKDNNAVKVMAKGNGYLRYYLENMWEDTHLTIPVASEGYKEYLLYFGDETFGAKSGLCILANTQDILIESIEFLTVDFSADNFASEQHSDLWGYNAEYGTPSYNSEESAMVFPANNNTWTYTLNFALLKLAKEAGYNALTVTAKGGSGYVNVFVSGEWNSDESMTLNDGANYVTRTLYFGDLAITEDSGITVLATSGDVFLKEIRFVKTDPAEGLVQG